MSALSYICDYGGSNSEDSDSDLNSSSKVKKAKLHVPDLSHIVVVSTDSHKDDPDIHGGRKRSFPHERGNWASFVYVKYPDEEFLQRLINQLQEEVCVSEKSSQSCDNIHISLSKTFVLKYHLITPFSTSLQKALCDTDCFELSFDSVKVYCNEDQTRTFIALGVDYFSNKYLTKISQKIDEVLNEYRLPKFYDDPSFHISLLWFNGNKKKELHNILDKLNNILQKNLQQVNKTVCISQVNCKIGNKHFQYSLQV